MAMMKAAMAAVLVMEKEGITQAFGVPGAAINPLYAQMRERQSISHILARHVEGASHMAEGYTRAKPGNIGVCIGTSGPAGIRLLIEPINTFDIPSFYLNRTVQAIDLIDRVGSDNLWLQYDIYHAQRMEGEIAQTITKHLPRISHIQLADNPGRHEPGTGEINYPFIFNHLESLGYKGWIGCEYKPRGTTHEGLNWLEEITV